MKKSLRGHFRRFTQLICAVLYNCNFTGFANGMISRSQTKGICAPGLNCYSCPGAVVACPLGSLQNALMQSRYRVPYYLLGTLLLFGVLLGRVICGFLCPFGLLQELLHKLPTRKIKKNRVTRMASKLKYALLVILVLLVPLLYDMPAFCKFVCPAGTLEAGIPLVIFSEPLRALAGWLFSWKLLVLILCLTGMVFLYRFFCRFICPLGALYGLFNRLSVVGMAVDNHTCINCDRCVTHCKMDIHHVGDAECISCTECMDVCPTGAISFGVKGVHIRKEHLQTPPKAS